MVTASELRGATREQVQAIARRESSISQQNAEIEKRNAEAQAKYDADLKEYNEQVSAQAQQRQLEQEAYKELQESVDYSLRFAPGYIQSSRAVLVDRAYQAAGYPQGYGKNLYTQSIKGSGSYQSIQQQEEKMIKAGATPQEIKKELDKITIEGKMESVIGRVRPTQIITTSKIPTPTTIKSSEYPTGAAVFKGSEVGQADKGVVYVPAEEALKNQRWKNFVSNVGAISTIPQVKGIYQMGKDIVSPTVETTKRTYDIFKETFGPSVKGIGVMGKEIIEPTTTTIRGVRTIISDISYPVKLQLEQTYGKPKDVGVTRWLSTAVPEKVGKVVTSEFERWGYKGSNVDLSMPRELFGIGTQVVKGGTNIISDFSSVYTRSNINIPQIPNVIPNKLKVTPSGIGKTAKITTSLGQYFVPYYGSTMIFGPAVEATTGGIMGGEKNVGQYVTAHPLETVLIGGIGAYQGFRNIPRAKYFGRTAAEEKIFQQNLLTATKTTQNIEKQSARFMKERVNWLTNLDKTSEKYGLNLKSGIYDKEFGILKESKTLFGGLSKQEQKSILDLADKLVKKGVYKTKQEAVTDLSISAYTIQSPTKLEIFGGTLGDIPKVVTLPGLKYSQFALRTKPRIVVDVQQALRRGDITKGLGARYQIGAGGKKIAREIYTISTKGKLAKIDVFKSARTTRRKAGDFIIERYPLQQTSTNIIKLGKQKVKNIGDNIVFREYAQEPRVSYNILGRKITNEELIDRLSQSKIGKETQKQFLKAVKTPKKITEELFFPTGKEIKLDISPDLVSLSKTKQFEKLGVTKDFQEVIKVKVPNIIRGKKTPFSKTFGEGRQVQQQVQEQVQQVISKEKLNIRPKITPKISIPRGTQISVGENLPLMVGGKGLVTIPYAATMTYERTELGAAQLPGQILTTRTEVITKQEPKVTTMEITKLSNRNLLNLAQVPSQVPKLAEVQISVPKQVVIQKQQQKQVQKSLLRQIQQQVSKTKTITPKTPTIKVPAPSTGGDLFKKLKKVVGTKAYKVEVRKGGKFIGIGKPLPLGRALQLGVKETTTTLRQTFRLKPAGETTEQDITFNVPSSIFTKLRRPTSEMEWVERRGMTLKKGTGEIPEIMKAQKSKQVFFGKSKRSKSFLF